VLNSRGKVLNHRTKVLNWRGKALNWRAKSPTGWRRGKGYPHSGSAAGRLAATKVLNSPSKVLNWRAKIDGRLLLEARGATAPPRPMHGG
jgi:hypothetical protein